MSDENTNTPTVLPEDQQQSQALILTASSILFGFLGPLILYFVWKDKNPLVERVGKKVVNTMITLFVACIAIMIVAVILSIVISAIIGLLMYLVMFVLCLYVTIKATLDVNKKEYDKVQFPKFTIQVLK